MTRAPLTVLAIDDDAGGAELLRRHLEQIEAYCIPFVHASSLAGANDALAKDPGDHFARHSPEGKRMLAIRALPRKYSADRVLPC